MGESGKQKRRKYTWPRDARVLIIQYKARVQSGSDSNSPPTVSSLVTDIAEMTGYPRDVCFRFVRQLGVGEKRVHKGWTSGEQQRLLDLIALNPPNEVAKILKRTPGAIHRMLRRLGASAQMGREWFTVITLAQALHISSHEVQKWIDRGWLRSRLVETGVLTKRIIDADAFSEFCQQHRTEIIGRRLSVDRLEFVRTFVFPPSHTQLLKVREGGYKRKSSREEGDDKPREDRSDHAKPDEFGAENF